MNKPQDLPARTEIGLAAAAHLELGLLALQTGHLPAAIGSLASIDEASWSAIVRRFPHLPAVIERWSNPR